MTQILQIITGCLGSAGFALLYNIRGKRFVFAALGGLLATLFYILFGLFMENEILNYFICAVLASLYAEIMARILKTPTTTFIITSLIPLIPGGSLYYTMTGAFSGDFEYFVSKGLYTLGLAGALAAGIIVVVSIVKIVVRKR
ncbi:MAG: threonine/serine exporter family protein [Clostridia bacterium]|nr:threonine/serine exporter family protein [Clostridia bacterium]